jgi:DegT/DnrJ/EryC1/StrS aminotransferase family protein
MRVTRKPDIGWLNYVRPEPARRPASPFPFSHGRTALTYGVRAIGLPEGAEVLCPDFVCYTLTDALEQAGLRVRLHPLAEDLGPDWSALDRVPAGAAAALVMVHYFGVPQDAARYRTYCDERGFCLIEDNAHGYGAEVDGRQAGTFGDIGISSPYKSFPIRNGGLLYLRRGTAFDLPRLPCQPVGLPVRLGRAALRAVLDVHLPLRAALRPCPPYDSQAAFRDLGIREWALDQWSCDEIFRADLPALRARRQALYAVWQRWTSLHGLKPVFGALPAGAMPLVYPAFSPSFEASERWFRWGHRHGIDVHSWPTLPESVVREDGAAMRRWERLVCFPLHQGIDPGALEAALRRLAPPAPGRNAAAVGARGAAPHPFHTGS